MKGEREDRKNSRSMERGELLLYYRGDPTVQYRLHTYKCLSVFLYAHTCMCIQLCLMCGFEASAWMAVRGCIFHKKQGTMAHQHLPGTAEEIPVILLHLPLS